MGLLTKKTEEEKAAEAQVKAQAQAEKQAADAASAERLRAHVASIPKWEYQVKRIGEDKQKGLLGSQRMETIFNAEGKSGWELVSIHEERATFKRRLAE